MEWLSRKLRLLKWSVIECDCILRCFIQFESAEKMFWCRDGRSWMEVGERFLKNFLYLEMLSSWTVLSVLINVTDAAGPHFPFLRLEACHSRLLDSYIIAAVVGGPGGLLGPDCHLKVLATARCPWGRMEERVGPPACHSPGGTLFALSSM